MNAPNNKRVVMASGITDATIDPLWAKGELPSIPTHEAVLAMMANGDIGGIVTIRQLALFYRAMVLTYEGEIERLRTEIETQEFTGDGNE